MKKWLWVHLAVLAILLAACGQPAQPATSPQTPSGEVFMIALPRIVIDFDSEGYPSILDIKLADVGLGGFKLDKSLVDLMTAGNVQHIELRLVGSGLELFVNGKLLPNIGWDDDSLLLTSDMASLFGVPDAQVRIAKELVPIVRRLGVHLAARFPRKAGAAEIPFMNPEQPTKAAAPAAAELSAAVVKFEVKYDQNGVPGILGISASDLAATGISLPAALAPDMLQKLQAKNIQHIELRGRPEGFFIYVNSKPLPNIVWGQTALTNAAELFAQMNPTSLYTGLVKAVVPSMYKADIAILVHFPLASGAEPIPVQMH